MGRAIAAHSRQHTADSKRPAVRGSALTYERAAQQLCEQARAFHAKDWMCGTSGNLSLRIARRPLQFAITASARDKSRLTPSDILLVNERGRVLAPASRARHLKPSVETPLHAALYELFPKSGAVFHVHTHHATVLTSRLPEGAALHAFRVERLEMLKGFNLWMQQPVVDLPVFSNWLDVTRIAAKVRAYYASPRPLPVFLIAHHGVTAWGRDPAEAAKHVELIDFICHYLWTTGAQPRPIDSAGRG